MEFVYFVGVIILLKLKAKVLGEHIGGTGWIASNSLSVYQ